MLNQTKNVALGVGQGIEPPLAIMDDDDDVIAAAVSVWADTAPHP